MDRIDKMTLVLTKSKKLQKSERFFNIILLWGPLFTQWPATVFTQSVVPEGRKATIIKLSVLPEVGSKFKGAIEKSSGKEFVNENDALKFRNISLRGPWTSGGIEFNFGVIGHSPHTFEKVDYVMKKNHDGSVSCIVGTLDLASRSEWRVNIRLPNDKAYFETNSFFYNTTPIDQSNYVWLTAAAKTSGNLEVIYPGAVAARNIGKEKEGLSLLEEIAVQTKSPTASRALLKYKGDELQAQKFAREISGNDYFNLMLQVLEMQK